MYDFDGFERREMALQVNSLACGDNIRALMAEEAKACPNAQRIEEIKAEGRRLWREKQEIYSGNIEVQQRLADIGFGRRKEED